MKLALALLLAACTPAPPASLDGAWMVSIFDANEPPPVYSLSFPMAFAQSGGLVVGLGFIGSRPLVASGTCSEDGCKLEAIFAETRFLWSVRFTWYGWSGTSRVPGTRTPRDLDLGDEPGPYVVISARALTDAD